MSFCHKFDGTLSKLTNYLSLMEYCVSSEKTDVGLIISNMKSNKDLNITIGKLYNIRKCFILFYVNKI